VVRDNTCGSDGFQNPATKGQKQKSTTHKKKTANSKQENHKNILKMP